MRIIIAPSVLWQIVDACFKAREALRMADAAFIDLCRACWSGPVSIWTQDRWTRDWFDGECFAVRPVDG